MPEQASTDWGKQGISGFARDVANEQQTPLGPNAKFTGGWTRIDKAASFMVLYGTHVPFTMQIQWSKDGITRDTDPFATISPQVRFALGLYSVISPQSTFFRPYFRVVITNGPAQQFFVVSDVLILDTIFPGYQIGVDGPIPVLGLANLNIGLQWGRTPTDWQPMQLTALKNQKVALAENLLGTLPVNVGNFPAVQPVSGAVAVSNFPATQPISAAALPLPAGAATEATLAALLAASPTAGGNFTHLLATGTTVVKSGGGVLERVVVNRISAAGIVLLTLYNALNTSGPQIAVLQIGATAPGSSGIIGPISLDYFLKFTTGLTANLGAGGADVTLVWR